LHLLIDKVLNLFSFKDSSSQYRTQQHEDDENKEDGLCNRGCSRSDVSKAEDSSYNCNNEKDGGPF
jgi:hypothetical protein